MKFLFVCEIPQNDGNTFEITCVIDKIILRRTQENFTQEELEAATVGFANMYTEQVLSSLGPLRDKIEAGVVLREQARSVIYEGYYHLIYAYVFRFLQTAPLAQDMQEGLREIRNHIGNLGLFGAAVPRPEDGEDGQGNAYNNNPPARPDSP